MKVKYFPKNFAGKDVGLGGRVIALSMGVALITTSPVYAISSGIDYLTRGKNFDVSDAGRFIDTLKLCCYTAMHGKFPEVEEKSREYVAVYKEGKVCGVVPTEIADELVETFKRELGGNFYHKSISREEAKEIKNKITNPPGTRTIESILSERKK